MDKHLVEFGYGRVSVMRTREFGESHDSGIAFVREEEVHPIGSMVDPGRVGKSTDEVGAFLRFHFANPESVQVLIDDLVIIRNSLINEADEGLAPEQ